MSIVTIDEMRTYLRAEQVDDEDWLQSSLDAAHQALYNMCGRPFEVADTVATARLYVPSCSAVLRIHDCTEITAVTESGTAVTSYQAEPVSPRLSGETRPYDQIRRLGSWWTTTGYAGEATVSVTAKWGWAATPPAAIEAVKVVCKDLATNRDVRAGFVSFAEGVAVARRNPWVMSFVADYGRMEATMGIA